MPERKRHHFVPVTYLKSWSGLDGKLYAFRGDAPGRPLHLRPEAIAFEMYFYSMRRPDGTRDNDSFEDMFGTAESSWPGVVEALQARTVQPVLLGRLYTMLALMRARVPAAREYNEALMAFETRTSLKVLDEIGRLPQKLELYGSELDTVEITINRERTLRTMGSDMLRFGDMTRRIGFEVLCNETGSDFITSDNPVAHFDPDDAGIRHPYINNAKVELFFPLTPKHVLHGANHLKRSGAFGGFRPVRDLARVRAINRIASRFAYRTAFARDCADAVLIARHGATSPVLDAKVRRRPGEIQFHVGHRFGPRPELPRFKPENCEDDLRDEDFDMP